MTLFRRMAGSRATICVAVAALALAASSSVRADEKKSSPSACKTSGGLGVHRTVIIDGAKAEKFGSVQFKDDFLKDKEVVLTFDDGPLAKYTRSILRALNKHCSKATFFAVGRMAMAFPSVIKEVADAGHTVAGHTWSHPKLSRLSKKRAKRDLEQGFSAVRSAIGRPIAPFFRFPYLDSPKWVQEYMKERKVAVFSIDIDSGDTRGYSVSRIVRKTMNNLKRRKKGILLFHDIKSRTAAAIPAILRKLKDGGYKVVHIVGKEPLETKKDYDELFDKKMLAKRKRKAVPAGTTSGPVKAKPRKAKPKRTNPFSNEDLAQNKTKAKRIAALRRARARRRAALRRRNANRKRRAKTRRKLVDTPKSTGDRFTFESVFGR